MSSYEHITRNHGLVMQEFLDRKALHRACTVGDDELAAELLRRPGIDVNGVDRRTWTSLGIATRRGHAKCVELLLGDARVDPNACARGNKFTPFMVAVCVGTMVKDTRLRIVRAFLECDRVNHHACAGRTGWTAMAFVGFRPFTWEPDVVRLLLEDGRLDPNVTGPGGRRAVLHRACANGAESLVRMLLADSRVDVRVRASGKQTALHLACEYKHPECVRLLLEDGRLDGNARDQYGMTPWLCAVESGCGDCFEMMRTHSEVDCHARDRCNKNALHYACQNGRASFVDVLIREMAFDIECRDNSGYTPYLSACEGGDLRTMDTLCATGRVNVYARSNSGRTALHIACAAGRVDAVSRLMLDRNLDWNARTNDGYTPFLLSCKAESSGVAEMLLATKGIDVGAKTPRRQSALHLACEAGRMCTCMLLAGDSRIDINAVDRDGRTPFSYACCAHNNPELVERLRAHPGVDVTIADRKGWTALHWACNNWSCVPMLKVVLSAMSGYENARANTGDTPYLVACARGSISSIRALNACPAVNVNCRNSEAYTGLHLAIQRSCVAAVHTILECDRVDVNLRGGLVLREPGCRPHASDYSTPIFDALEPYIPSDIADALIASGKVDFSIRNHAWETVLGKLFEDASECGLRRLRAVLQCPGIDVNAATGFDDTPPILRACRIDTDWPLPNVGVPDAPQRTSMLEVVKTCARMNPNAADANGYTVLHAAISSGHDAWIEWLLRDDRVDVNALPYKNAYASHVCRDLPCNQRYPSQCLRACRALLRCARLNLDLIYSDYRYGLPTVLRRILLGLHEHVPELPVALERCKLATITGCIGAQPMIDDVLHEEVRRRRAWGTDADCLSGADRSRGAIVRALVIVSYRGCGTACLRA